MDFEISERRQVRVESADKAFVFVADPDVGKLTLREERPDGGGGDVCRITVEDRGEMAAFLEGLARVLGGRTEAVPGETPGAGDGVPGPAALGTAPARDGDRRGDDDAVDGGDRDEMVERARARNPKAFAPWSKDEERRLAEAYRAGTSVEDLAGAHKRSRRAIEMRLEKLGERS